MTYVTKLSVTRVFETTLSMAGTMWNFDFQIGYIYM